ncbi:hypothetical protein GCM10027036_21040 [Flavihumibacter cheonanensis]|uniref:DsrE family protein n=1 Tax=Flavihumibacter cheonanensis TaxID=1442385 RepID=UPI001EF8939D|nr:DsrE family protein [Flavihumibacter cheonanensis]MCG7754235.1 DsrE family protein [Flavihumibacter cheonanensis]
MKQLTILAVLLLSVINGAVAQTAEPKHKLVMQLNTSDTLIWKGLMNNLKNLKAGWGDSVKVEVVVHGAGVQFMMKDKTTQADKIAQFKKMGIEFVVCENTLRERNVSKDQLLPEAGFVKMGVGEIILKQEAGWSYIKL